MKTSDRQPAKKRRAKITGSSLEGLTLPMLTLMSTLMWMLLLLLDSTKIEKQFWLVP